LSEAEKAVSGETAQVRNTIEKAKKGKIDVDIAEKTTATSAASPLINKSEPTGDEDSADVTDSELADVDDVSDVADIDVSDVEELDQDDVADMVENTIAPPALVKRAQTPQPQVTELDEIDVAEVQTVSDVAADVAAKVATEVARRVTQNLTSDMAEEVAALVMARLAEAGINGNVADDQKISETKSVQSETSEYQEAMNE
jgi:hypothetical protein